MGEHLKLDVQNSHLISKLIDRKNKMSEQAFLSQAQTIVGSDTDKLMNLLSVTSIEDLPTSVVESGVVEDLRTLFDQLASNGVKNAKFDLTLMRGFDYYTGVVFEIFDENPVNKRSLFGGGRYDGLTTIFNKPSLPGLGFGMGDVGIYNFLETHNLLPAFPSSTDVYVIVIGDFQNQAQALAGQLRQKGIGVAIDITGRKADAQLKTALKQDIRYAILLANKK